MSLAKAPLTDVANRRAARLAGEAARAARERSASAARATYDDSRNSLFSETWANLSAWSSNALLQVSAGRLYSATTSGGNAGINRAINLGQTGVARFTGTLRAINGLGAQMVGFNNDTAGGAVSSNFLTFRGIYFRAGFGIQMYDKGVQTNLAPTSAVNVPGDWQWIALADANTYSVTLIDPNGVEYRTTKWARDGSFLLNNLMLFNSDGNTTTGASFGPIGGTLGYLSTFSPRAGVEGVNRTVLWTNSTSKTGARPVKIELPPSYDPRVPSPWVMFFHGAGSTEHQISDNTNVSGFLTSLIAAGFVVISANDNVYSVNWGAQSGLEGYAEAYQYARDTVNLGPGAFLCNSMGGIESLLTLADSRIPNVHAWAGTSPTYNLLTAYNNATFTSSMNGAFGFTTGTLGAAASPGATSISSSVSYPAGTVLLLDVGGVYEQVTVASAGPSGSGPYTLPLTGPLTAAHASGVAVSDYPTKAAGHDPALMAGTSFRGVPMLILAATDDTVIPRPTNTDLLKAAVAPYAAELIDTPGVTGGHGFNPSAGQIATVVAFFRKHLSV